MQPRGAIGRTRTSINISGITREEVNSFKLNRTKSKSSSIYEQLSQLAAFHGIPTEVRRLQNLFTIKLEKRLRKLDSIPNQRAK